MTKDQIKKYEKAAEEGTIPDDENPMFIFSLISSKLLTMGIRGEISFMQLAKMQLAARGQNLKGEWIGFEQAEQLLLGKKSPHRNKL